MDRRRIVFKWIELNSWWQKIWPNPLESYMTEFYTCPARGLAKISGICCHLVRAQDSWLPKDMTDMLLNEVKGEYRLNLWFWQEKDILRT